MAQFKDWSKTFLHSGLQTALTTVTDARTKVQVPGLFGQGAEGSQSTPRGIHVTPEAAAKIRWFDQQDVASLAAQHSKEKEDLFALNTALKQLLLQHGVPQSELDSELTFRLEEVEKLRKADTGVFSVLLTAAQQEVQELKKQPPAAAHSCPNTPPSVSPLVPIAPQPLSSLKDVVRNLAAAQTPHRVQDGEDGEETVEGIILPRDAMAQLTQAVEALEAAVAPDADATTAEQLPPHVANGHAEPAELTASQEQLAATQEQLAQNEQLLQQQAAEISGLHQHVEQLQTELKKQKEEADTTLQELRSRLQRSVQEHLAVLKQAQDICKSAEDRADAMERKADIAEVRAATADSEAKEARQELKRLEKELKRLQGEGWRREDATKLTARCRQLEEELASVNKSLGMLKASSEQLERRCSELEGVEASLSAELAEAEQALGHREALQLRVQALEERLKEHNMVCEQLAQSRALVTELDAKCAAQEQELVAAVQHAARMETRLTKLDVEVEICKTQAQSADLRALKAEQSISQEVTRRLAAANADPAHWPAAAKEAILQLERSCQQLREQVAADESQQQDLVKQTQLSQEQQHLLEQKLINAEERQQRMEWEHRQKCSVLQGELKQAREEIDECRTVIAAIQLQAREHTRALLSLENRNGSQVSLSSSTAGAGVPRSPSAAGMGHSGNSRPVRNDSMASDALSAGGEAGMREAVDMIYLKNVVLRFLDAYMNARATEVDALLPAVATVLRATPQEFKSLRQNVEGSSTWGSSLLSAVGINLSST